jgi:hypothetical protein
MLSLDRPNRSLQRIFVPHSSAQMMLSNIDIVPCNYTSTCNLNIRRWIAELRMHSAYLLIQQLLFKITFLTTKQNNLRTVCLQVEAFVTTCCQLRYAFSTEYLGLVNGTTMRLLLALSQQFATRLPFFVLCGALSKFCFFPTP